MVTVLQSVIIAQLYYQGIQTGQILSRRLLRHEPCTENGISLNCEYSAGSKKLYTRYIYLTAVRKAVHVVGLYVRHSKLIEVGDNRYLTEITL